MSETIIDRARSLFPDLESNVAQTGLVCGEYIVNSTDPVHRYLIETWNNLIINLPDHSPTVVPSLGAVALTMERVGIPEFAVFQAVAADIMKIHIQIANGEHDDVDEVEEDPHYSFCAGASTSIH